MQNLISSLVDKKYAYVTKKGVYFSVSKFAEYGKLSKKKTDDLVSGARVAVDKEKSNPIDFALWKFSNSEPSWDSPWGKGRPGWHIECSAMSLKYLGENFEIHGGGRDLIFPHHENEIAQSESSTSKQFAKIWMHVGMITINGEKMSKSLGNVKTVNHVLDNWGPNIIRLFCLSGSYSKPIDYSEKLLKENITKLRQIESCYYELRLSEGTGEETTAEKLVKECKEEFDSALNNDFNTPLALTAYYKLIREVDAIAADEKITQTSAGIILPEFERMSTILGIQILKVSDTEKNEINQMVKKRDEYRMQKNYKEADDIRAKIAEKNIIFVDHKNKTTWIKQEKIKAE
jgi:cysteinyl-tRNA synthetase